MVTIEDEIINQMQEPNKVETALTVPSVDAFKNFLSLAIADKTFGGAMDPTEGSSWRSGDLKDDFDRELSPLNLRDFVIESGGRSKESYAKKYDIPEEEIAIDTLSYQDPLNYKFNIGTEDEPEMFSTESSGYSTMGTGVDLSVNKYIDAYMGRKYDYENNPFGKLDAMKDKQVKEYREMRKYIFDVVDEEGVESALEQFPFLGPRYTKYSEAFGSN